MPIYLLLKAKKANIGEVRNRKGGSYKKIAPGKWVSVGSGDKKEGKKEKESKQNITISQISELAKKIRSLDEKSRVISSKHQDIWKEHIRADAKDSFGRYQPAHEQIKWLEQTASMHKEKGKEKNYGYISKAELKADIDKTEKRKKLSFKSKQELKKKKDFYENYDTHMKVIENMISAHSKGAKVHEKTQKINEESLKLKEQSNEMFKKVPADKRKEVSDKVNKILYPALHGSRKE